MNPHVSKKIFWNPKDQLVNLYRSSPCQHVFFVFANDGWVHELGKIHCSGDCATTVASDTLVGVHANAALQRGGWVDRKKGWREDFRYKFWGWLKFNYTINDSKWVEKLNHQLVHDISLYFWVYRFGL